MHRSVFENAIIATMEKRMLQPVGKIFAEREKHRLHEFVETDGAYSQEWALRTASTRQRAASCRSPRASAVRMSPGVASCMML